MSSLTSSCVFSALLFVCLSGMSYQQTYVEMGYKSEVELNCKSLEGDVEFFEEKAGSANKTKIENLHSKFQIDDKVLKIMDIRGENLRAVYSCKSDKGKDIVFTNRIKPYIYKPEKQSVTTTEGSSIELKCVLLFGNEGGEEVTWSWQKNTTQLVNDEKYEIKSSDNETSITLKNVNNDDKGLYECVLKNKYGEHSEEIRLRIKDAYAALWPFIAIVAEVLVLCIIILICEKKCTKKPKTSEEDNEQSKNLMGKDGH